MEQKDRDILIYIKTKLDTIDDRGSLAGEKRSRRMHDKFTKDVGDLYKHINIKDSNTNGRIDNQRIATGVVGALAIIIAGFISWVQGH